MAPARKPLSTSTSVSPEERRARRLLAERSGGVCECCDMRRATDASHRKRRTQGGPWCPANLLHACRSCHLLIDDPTQPTPRYCGWHLDRNQDPLTVPVFLPARDRWVLLDADGGVTPCGPPDLEGDVA